MKVRNEKEEVVFIKSFLCSKNLAKPKWLKEGKVHYPLCLRASPSVRNSIEQWGGK